MINEIIDTGLNYFKQGLSAIRNLIGQGIALTSFDAGLGTMILMAVLSLIGGYFLAKGFALSPFSKHYILRTLIISLLIFLILYAF